MIARCKAALARPGVALFALVFVAYAYFYQAGGWNQNSRFDLTRTIVEQRSLAIDRYAKNTWDTARRDGRMYSDKAPGVSFLAVPAWAAVYAVAARPPRPDQLAVGAWLATVTSIGLPSALAVVLMMVLAGALGLTRARAAVIAAGWGLATLAFPYSTLLYGHQLIAAMLLAAFALLVTARGRAGGASALRLAAVGALLGAAVAVEYTAALAAAPIAAYALAVAPWRRAVLAVSAGVAGPAVLLATYHAVAFGGPFTLPYEFSIQKHRHQGWFMGLGAPDPNALGHITFSVYRGLFYTAPWLLLAVPGAVRLWRRGHRAEVGVCASIVILFLWLNASLVDWQGGWAMGPRYLIPAIPFLVVLAAGVLAPPAAAAWVPARVSAVLGDRRVRAAGLAALGTALVVSAAIMLIGTAVRPEVDSAKRRPVTFLLEHWERGELGISTQSIDMLTGPRGGRPRAWNLGHRVGLAGRASLVPLAVAWAACGIWLAVALRRVARHEAAAGDTS